MEVAIWTGAILGVASVIGITVKLGTATWRGVRRVNHFLDDWFGEPARVGVPARLGVMARLEAVEHDVTDIKAHIGMEGAA